MSSDKVEKKRKRASDIHNRPSKKPAIDLPPLKAGLLKDDSDFAPVFGKSCYVYFLHYQWWLSIVAR